VTIFYALLAALCNALNVIAQHLGSITSAEKSKGWHFVVALLRNPMWLAGWGALAGGFVFQALALHAGQLSVVQPLLVTELVFALALRRVWLHQPIRVVTWWAATLTCVSLSLFLAMSEPQGGTQYPDSSAGSATQSPLRRRLSAVLGWQGGGEKVGDQLRDALSLVVMDPMRGVGQALDPVEVGHIVVVGLG